jgi:hypothetical protein
MMIGAGVNFATKGFARLGEVVGNLPNDHLDSFSGLVSTIMWSMTVMVGLLGATAIALMYFGSLASAPPMWMAAVVLLAIGAAAALVGVGIWAAATGMSSLVDSFSGLAVIEGVGATLAGIGGGLLMMAGGLTMMANPMALLGMLAANKFLNNVAGYGPGLLSAGQGISLLKENLTGLGTALQAVDGNDSIFGKLAALDKLITRTQSKPIIVEVGGDVGGKILVDFKDISRDISVSDLSDDFVTEITRKISDELQKGNYGRSKEK